MRNVLRPLLLITLVLLIPIVPFLVLGDRFESGVAHQLEQQTTRGGATAFVIGALATDVLLPIPSSLISTLGGARLGWLAGTVASWFGMSVGASLGFAVARSWGRRIALWFTTEDDLQRMHTAADAWGTMVLVVTRALPVVAEASVLFFGLHRLPWRRFLPPVLVSNLVIAFVYSAFGDWAHQRSWLPVAMGISIALPLLIAAIAQRWFRRHAPS